MNRFSALSKSVQYDAYDLTNLAVMKGFTLKIALIDLFWGTILTATTAALTVMVASAAVGR